MRSGLIGVFIQAHEQVGSAAVSGGAPGPFVIQGWIGFGMPHRDPETVDHVEVIGDDEAEPRGVVWVQLRDAGVLPPVRAR